MGGRMPYSPCKKPHAPSREGSAERWPSGLRRTLGKRVCGKLYRGFESHSLRQQVSDVTETIVKPAKCATFPKVRDHFRESSKLRARITTSFCGQVSQFSEEHFASTV